jgi:hypothetical protein
MAYALLAHTKAGGPLRLIRVWMLAHIPGQLDPVDLRRRFVARQAGFNAVDPSHHGRNTHAKPFRHLGNR